MATSRLVVVRCLSKPTLQDNPITLVVKSRVAYKVSEQQRKIGKIFSVSGLRTWVKGFSGLAQGGQTFLLTMYYRLTC